MQLPLLFETTYNVITYYLKDSLSFIRSHLDHGLCAKSFIDFWSKVSYCLLLRHHFYHHPLLLLASTARSRGPRQFQFHGIWIQASLIGVVVGTHMEIKSTLNIWNREVFGNLDHNIESAFATLTEL